MLPQDQWDRFERDGFLPLGPVLSDAELGRMQRRLDDIMLGRADVPYGRMLMQLDSQTGLYGDAGEQSRGHKGPTLNYRKIQDLELDPLFLEFLRRPLFRHVCERVHGPGRPIALYRAMFMNKPAGRGTFLPWHQDRWRDLDCDPQITLWLALDPATRHNGCVRVVPGSHRDLINPDHPSGFLTEEQAARLCPPGRAVDLEVLPGHAVLLHNWLLHSSDRNRSDQSRRAFSVCYMDAETRSLRSPPEEFFRVFDAVAAPA